MNRSTVRCFLTVLACTALKGCVAMQMYPGPTLPDDQIATIEPTIAYYWIFGDREVAAVSFDSGLIGEPLAVLEVLPGRHLVGVRYIGSAFGTPVRNDNPCYLVVDAAAGHQYKVDGEHGVGADLWTCWVSDLETKTRNAGIVLAGQLPPREELPAFLDAMAAEVARRSAVAPDGTDHLWRRTGDVPISPASDQTTTALPLAPVAYR